MKPEFLLSAIVVATGAIALPSTGAPVFELAQSADDVIGQVNPNQPIKIEVVNGGNAPITVQLTQPPSNLRRVEPGSRVSFGSTTTQYLPPPIHLLAYPDNSQIGLSSDVFVENNTVTVVIGEQLSETQGSIAVNINQEGAVTLF